MFVHACAFAVGSCMAYPCPGCGGGSRGFTLAAALPSPASAPVLPERALSAPVLPERTFTEDRGKPYFDSLLQATVRLDSSLRAAS